MACIILGISSFYIGDASSSAWSGGSFPSMRYMIPQSFAAGGNRSYLEFWAVIGGLRVNVPPFSKDG
jgi:hypothetical protein